MQYNPQLLNTLKIYSYLKFSQHKDRDVKLHPVQQVTKRQGRSLRHMHTQRLESNITYVLESKGLNVIHEVLQTRPWITEVKNSEQAMIRWKATSFKLEFNNQQLINHYSNHNEITNKQKLYVNIQHNTFVKCHLPQTYIIRKTEDLIKFIQHLKEGLVFLLKPTNQNRGQGIGLFKNLTQLKSLALEHKEYIIQEYIRPYLIEGRKFDFRIWVLLDQNRKLYWCREGYLRLSSEKFNYEDTENKYIHLTNWAIQKDHRRFGSRESGNQLSFNQFNKIEPRFQKLIIHKFKQIIVCVFEQCIAKIDPYHYKGTFELFGFDFMIDPNLNVYLIEINTNPCLERCSNWLKILIPRMLNNLFAIVIDQFFKRQCANIFPLDGYSLDENIWYFIKNKSKLGNNYVYFEYIQYIIQNNQICVWDQHLMQHVVLVWHVAKWHAVAANLVQVPQ